MAAKKEAVAAKAVNLVAVEPIRYDGADIAPGETFVADETSSKALVGSGAAKLSDDVAA